MGGSLPQVPAGEVVGYSVAGVAAACFARALRTFSIRVSLSAYLLDEQIELMLNHLAALEGDTLLIAEMCLATRARWGRLKVCNRARFARSSFTTAKPSPARIGRF